MSKDTIDNNISIDPDLSEVLEGLRDPMVMTNVVGKLVKIEHIDFSFYFSDKPGMNRRIRVMIKWDRDDIFNPLDGYMDLYGQYDYVQSEHGENASAIEISKARDFFMKYKVLFAAVWERRLDAWNVQFYFNGEMSFDELKREFEEIPKDILKDGKTIADIEDIVRKNQLFDMKD